METTITTTTMATATTPKDPHSKWVSVIDQGNLTVTAIAKLGDERVTFAVDNSGSTDTSLTSGNFGYGQGAGAKVLLIEAQIVKGIVQPGSKGCTWDTAAHVIPASSLLAIKSNGGTDPACIAKNAQMQELINSAQLLVKATDGQIGQSEVANFAAQQATCYSNLGAFIVVLVTDRNTLPAAQNVSVFAAITKPVLVLHADSVASLKVLHATGTFVPQLIEIGIVVPQLNTNPAWKLMPDITIEQIRALTITCLPPLPKGFREVTNPESYAIFGRPFAISLTALLERLTTSEPLTGQEFNIFKMAFDQLLREAITTNNLAGLESVIKCVERQAVKSTEISTGPAALALSAATQRIVYLLSSGDDGAKIELIKVRESLPGLREAAAQEAKILLEGPRRFLHEVRQFTQDCLARIAEARSAGNQYSAGSFFSSAANRVKKAAVVDADDFALMTFDQKGALELECPICCVSGPVCCAMRKNLTLDERQKISGDNVLNFPLAFGHLGVEVGLLVPGEQPICLGCASQLTISPFTRTPEVWWLPVISCEIPANREYLQKLLAVHWTDGAVMAQSTRLLLATFVQLKKTTKWFDAEVFDFMGRELLKFTCTDNMADTGNRVPLTKACGTILNMTTATAEFPFGALYRQPFSAIQTILYLGETFQLDGRPMKTDRIVQTAFSYTICTTWLQLLHPNASVEQKTRHATLIKMIMSSLFDYSTGTSKYMSGRIMSLENVMSVLGELFQRDPRTLEVPIDCMQLSIIFACLIGLQRHESLSNAVSLFRRHKGFGQFFTDLIDNPLLLSMKGRDIEFVTILNNFQFNGCCIVERENSVPQLATPYGASCFVFQAKEGNIEPFALGSWETLAQAVSALDAGRKEIFRKIFHTTDVAPCAGSSSYSGVQCVINFYNALSADQLPKAPTRGAMLAILKKLFEDGRGGISEPFLIESIVLLMGSYLEVRSRWTEPISNTNTLAGRMSFESKVLLEFEALGIGTEGPFVLTTEVCAKLFPNGSRYTQEMFVKSFGQDLWVALSAPLTKEELDQVFIDNRYKF